MRPERSAGQGLLELVVVLALTSLLAVAVGGLLVAFSSIARQASSRTDLARGERVVGAELSRALRLAGRGGLPAGLAVEVINHTDRVGSLGSRRVRPETDVLILRGLGSGRYEVIGESSSGDLDTLLLATSTSEGEVADLLIGEALVRVDGLGGCEVGELVESPRIADETATVTLRTAGSERAAGYSSLAGQCGDRRPEAPNLLGTLEEVWYYVRVGAGPSGEAFSRLARVRVWPGTREIHSESFGRSGDLVEDVTDLQVALGLDGNGDGRLEPVGEGRGPDEWWLNEASDAEDRPTGSLLAVRATVLLSGSQRLPRFQARVLEGLEDRVYDEAVVPRSIERSRLRVVGSWTVGWRSIW